MKTITYQIEFFSYWHASSGLAGSTYADILVNKTREGLPYIPGRTLKGLLREAAEVLHEFDPKFITAPFILDIFGQKPTNEEIEVEDATTEAKCFFCNARLSLHLQTAIREDQKSYLYNVLASTKIDTTGLADEGTLRQLEVAIPLTLTASIEHFPEEPDYERQIVRCFQWIKRMGLNRSRGLGRCQFSMTKNS